MEENKFSHEDLVEVIAFLAKEKNILPEEFINENKEKINQQKIESSDLFDKFTKLDKNQQHKILQQLENIICKNNNKKPTSSIVKKYDAVPINELNYLDTNELVKTKPSVFFIDDKKFDVNSWADVTDNFVKHLIINGDITKYDLPFSNNDRSSKVYINSVGEQPNGKDGFFHKIADGFYVDIKYNAKYHILNILRTLKKLSITNKYNIKIGF